MTSRDRVQIYPSRGALLGVGGRLAAASKGHALLKKKSDALQSRFRTITRTIILRKAEISKMTKDAMFTLAEAKFASGDFNQQVMADVGTAWTRVSRGRDNVAGVVLPVFTCISEGKEGYQLMGLAKGGQRFSSVRQVFQQILQELAGLATLQVAFQTLYAVIRSTNRRLNALEFVLIPRLERTISYIKTELDEQEIEDFYRLKLVQEKKRLERLQQAASPYPSHFFVPSPSVFTSYQDEAEDVLF